MPIESRGIQLRGVTVNNLRSIDLDVPSRKLTVFCGVSGSGKTSVALDTLYAEGQRRYIESFSAYTRQFLARLPKPDAERIEGLPPAIAITHRQNSASNRATVGTATEVIDYLRLLFSRIGIHHCPQCGRQISADSADSIASAIGDLPERTRYMVSFGAIRDSEMRWIDKLRQEGFVRWIADGRCFTLNDFDEGNAPVESNERAKNDEECPLRSEAPSNAHGESLPEQAAEHASQHAAEREVVDVVIDRLSVSTGDAHRVRESIETALDKGGDRCAIYFPATIADDLTSAFSIPRDALRTYPVDGKPWIRVSFSRRLECEACDVTLAAIDPRLFSFSSPMGACPMCEGFGNTMEFDENLVVPDPTKTLEAGAIAPWNSPAYKHELTELLQLASDYNVRTDVPFRELTARERAIIQEGVPERNFGGLSGFFEWLERRKYKMHVRVFLSRWRSYRVCELCGGSRLRPEALATRVGGKNLAELCRMPAHALLATLESVQLDSGRSDALAMILDQIRSRLGYLVSIGLHYLSMDRSLRTLSSGESQRVALTSALGSSLVNMLYVLDEPSMGLHPCDVTGLIRAVHGLRDRGNTVIMVEHDEALIRAADHVVELGPGAGEDGGNVTYEGGVDQMCDTAGVLTGDYLMRRRGFALSASRRPTQQGWVKLTGARGNNLKDLEVEFPLGVLCMVTGVSGSGKSTLVERTLYPALARRKGMDEARPLPFDEIVGCGQLDEVLLVDQSPIGRSPRSNPVTYIKAFDAIRKVYAETLEARTRNLKASHFSFNVDGGRCPACQGDGTVAIDMQFLADVHMQCTECKGRRYRREILDVLYRGKNIAQVLQMSVRRAHAFFRGQTKVQNKLQQLIDVGLDYLKLGQAANTLSSGEAQRLKLAGYLTSARRGRTLFLLDEPTTGLHYSDVVQLLDCFEALLDMGHSLIIVEHKLQMLQAADYIIDLGPGAADAGGQVIAAGTPEEIAQCAASATGRVLAPRLHNDSELAS